MLAGFSLPLAVSWSPLSLSRHLPVGCLSALMTWLVSFSRVSDSKEKEREGAKDGSCIFPNLISEVMHRCFCCVLLVTQTNRIWCGRTLSRLWLQKEVRGTLEADCHRTVVPKSSWGSELHSNGLGSHPSEAKSLPLWDQVVFVSTHR